MFSQKKKIEENDSSRLAKKQSRRSESKDGANERRSKGKRNERRSKHKKNRDGHGDEDRRNASLSNTSSIVPYKESGREQQEHHGEQNNGYLHGEDNVFEEDDISL